MAIPKTILSDNVPDVSSHGSKAPQTSSLTSNVQTTWVQWENRQAKRAKDQIQNLLTTHRDRLAPEMEELRHKVSTMERQLANATTERNALERQLSDERKRWEPIQKVCKTFSMDPSTLSGVLHGFITLHLTNTPDFAQAAAKYLEDRGWREQQRDWYDSHTASSFSLRGALSVQCQRSYDALLTATF